MPATQRQRRYDQVMGDKEPDVADKKFVHELQTRLEIKYYESQLAKEKQLAESEKRRMRKLVMEGVVEGDDRRQSKGDDQRDSDWKEFWPPNPNKTLEEYEEERRRAEEKHQKEAAAEEERNRQEADEAAAAEGGSGEGQQTTGTAAPAGGGGAGTDRSGGGGGGGAASAPAVIRQDFLLLVKCLNNFHLPHLDGDRIVQLCSLYLKHQSTIMVQEQQQQPPQQQNDAFAVGKFLANILVHLSRLGQHSDSRLYTGPLRALELALGSDCGCPGDSSALRQYLASKGYFGRLTAFIAAKCGLESRADLSDALSQPLVQSLCSLLTLPLGRAVDDADLDGCLELAGHLLRQTLCCPTACTARGHHPAAAAPAAAAVSPRVACHLIGPLLAAASLGPLLLAAAQTVAQSGQPGPGLLHLLACRGRGLLLTSPEVESARRLLLAVHLCCPCLRELPDDLAEEVRTGLASDWFAETLRLAMSAEPPLESFAHLSSVCVLCPSLSLYSLTPAGPPRAAFLRAFWRAIAQFNRLSDGAAPPLVQLIARSVPPEPLALAALHPLLATYARLFSPDPLPRQCLLALSGELRDLLLGLLLLSHPDTRPDLLNADYVRALRSLGDPDAAAADAAASATSAGSGDSSRQLLELYSGLFSSVKLLVSRLYSLDQLRRFTASPTDEAATSAHWSVQGRVPPIKSLQPAYWLEREINAGASFGYYSVLNDTVNIPYLTSTERLQLAILTEAPYLINFWDRVRLLYDLLQAYKASIDYDRHEFGASGIRVSARRGKIYEDAFSQLYALDNLYPRLRVVFRNELGLEEAGIDGGGLMREFLALVLSAAFDPERGFYSQTSSGALYPNPLSPAINPEYAAHYFFHGKLLGKLVFERLLIDLPLAPFFLRRVIIYASGSRDSHQRAAASLEELVELDPELYKNVSALSGASADDLDAMELDFSIAEDRLGRSETVELKPDGGAVRVTRDNVSEYQQLLADYRLRRQIAAQVQAFAQGLVSVIPCPDWLSFFSHKELQLLVSGSDSPIDVLDLRRHAAYQGCTAESETVAAFWRLMLEDFSESQRRAVLRFVTSLARAPLYGWQELQPPFTVVLVPETDRLPSSSTCINLLKLPDYRDAESLRQKLLMAVESNSGFELS